MRALVRSLLAPVACAVALALALMVPVTPAGAAVEGLSIRKVDTSAFPEVRVSALFTGARPDIRSVSVRENGRIVPDLTVTPLAETSTPVGIVLVLDTSGSMRAGGRLDQAVQAARSFVDGKAPNDEIAIVTFGNEPRIAMNFTSDQGALGTALNGVAPAGETALWDAVRTGANLLGERRELLPYLVVLSDGADTVSRSSAADAVGAARGVQAGVFAIAITGAGESDVPALRSLADSTGGTFGETTDARQLGRLYEGVRGALQNQYELRWTSKATSNPLELTVQVAGARADATAALHGVSFGSASQPRHVEAPTVPSPLDGGRGPVLAAALTALAAALAVSAAFLLRSDRRGLDDVLQAYDAERATPGTAAAAERSVVPEAVRRAVETTARFAGGRSAIERIDAKLDQADLKLRAQEGLLLYAGGVLLATAAATAMGGPIIGLAALIVVGLLPPALLNQLAGRRRGAFTRQLPDTLQLLASSLRAGYSLLQGLDAVAEEVDDPMGRELRRVVLETRLGRELEAALDDLAGRMKSPDFDWVVMAIRIQREVGGNLAELLSSVAETMVSRARLRREVSALTAEGRLSAMIVGALPLVITVAIMVLNPGYLDQLFAATIGKIMILGATVLTLVGFVWMRKMIQIDV